jgi:hypothetical protein
MFESPIGAAIAAIRIGRNEDCEAHGSLLALSGGHGLLRCNVRL